VSPACSDNPDDSKELTDAELLTQFAAGDEAAFREIVDRYKNGLHAFLGKSYFFHIFKDSLTNKWPRF